MWQIWFLEESTILDSIPGMVQRSALLALPDIPGILSTFLVPIFLLSDFKSLLSPPPFKELNFKEKKNRDLLCHMDLPFIDSWEKQVLTIRKWILMTLELLKTFVQMVPHG